MHALTTALAEGLGRLGFRTVIDEPFFDTLRDPVGQGRADRGRCRSSAESTFALGDDGASIGISLDETTTRARRRGALEVFAGGRAIDFTVDRHSTDRSGGVSLQSTQTSPAQAAYLTHPVFNRYHSETEMLRYIRTLESRDLSLTHSMIPLGSCTMKLNGTSEMLPVTWPEFGRLHPFAPADQADGYPQLCAQLEKWLAEVTGFAAVSLQPNAGSQGEYAGLLAIRGYHESRGEKQRDVCLIPVSAHGTNPSSAVVAGFKVVAVECDARRQRRCCRPEAKATSTRPARRADDHLPVNAWRLRRRGGGHLPRSFTSMAGRSTWTART